MIILGIDPGIANIGFGIIREVRSQRVKAKNNFKCLGYGLIQTSPSLTTPERLKKLSNELSGLIKKYRPKVLAVENVYFFKNLKTVMAVSQAEGVIFLAAARKKIPVYELAPLEVKMTITGHGRAEKSEVQKRIKKLLNLNETPKPDDAADALAIAITCSLKRA
jgi:crossover junction endodeoxyribonuclease RuvC